MVKCVACGCIRNNINVQLGISFHKFPSDERRKEIWVNFVNIENFVPNANSYLCSRHFDRSFFKTNRAGIVQLIRLAVPTIGIIPNYNVFKENLLRPPSFISPQSSKQHIIVSYDDQEQVIELNNDSHEAVMNLMISEATDDDQEDEDQGIQILQNIVIPATKPKKPKQPKQKIEANYNVNLPQLKPLPTDTPEIRELKNKIQSLNKDDMQNNHQLMGLQKRIASQNNEIRRLKMLINASIVQKSMIKPE